nr:hypothetical protein [uncultured Mediterranean phage uvMED]BAR31516.1 hypothetical protein [uncultured Mediterranean phage uvMED]|tara:strand:- start:14 stop:232 length:219 start_codon:yes stop_codon:yes gene_type:complete
MFLLALRKQYEADVAEATAVIDTFLQKAVGVADHDNFMKSLRTNFDKLVHAKHAISEIDEITKNSKETNDKK